MKRFLDVIFSFLLIVLLLPLFIILSVLILVVDGKPIFFRQERIGYHGKIFDIYKFRTMKVGTRQAATENLYEASEVTSRIGKIMRKFSLDELPQLFNILKGDMSFIGPRPLIPLEQEIHQLRLKYNVYSVRPGMTGWAQVNGRDNLDFESKALFDKEYVENRSLKMDFKIIIKTVTDVIRGKDVKDN